MFKHLFSTARRTDPRTIVKCNFTGADGTLLTNYLWSDPLDVRPGSNQWTLLAGQSVQITSNEAIQPSAFPVRPIMTIESYVNNILANQNISSGYSTIISQELCQILR